jgi:hypothetical protein
MKRADAIRFDRQVASGQLGGGGAGEASDEYGIRAEAFDSPPNLAG